jgi:hypothetical protein
MILLGWIPERGRDSPPRLHIQTGSRAHWVPRVLSVGVKRQKREADHPAQQVTRSRMCGALMWCSTPSHTACLISMFTSKPYSLHPEDWDSKVHPTTPLYDLESEALFPHLHGMISLPLYGWFLGYLTTLSYHPSIFLEKLGKTTKNLN